MPRQMLFGMRLRVLRTTLLLAGPTAAGPAALQAQQAELQLLGGQLSDESGAVRRGFTVVPALAFSGGQGWLRLDGRATALQGGGHLLGGGAAFHLALVRAGSIELGSSGSAGLLAAGSGFRSLSAEVAPGVRLHGGTGSVAAGVGVRGTSLSSTPTRRMDVLPLGERDREQRAVTRSVWGDGQVGLGPLAVGLHGRTSRAAERSWQEAQAAVSLQLGRVGLTGFAGARTGDAEGRWAGGTAAFRVAPGIELMAQLARLASDPLTGQPGGRTATMGVKLSLGGPAVRAGRTPGGLVRLALRATPNVRVDIMGDWNEWRPEPVAHRGDGVYEAEIHLPPGVYHFVFRVNGELRVPEGYETVPDDFGGRSAVVRVRG